MSYACDTENCDERMSWPLIKRSDSSLRTTTKRSNARTYHFCDLDHLAMWTYARILAESQDIDTT
jgi:hypothetical protein